MRRLICIMADGFGVFIRTKRANKLGDWLSAIRFRSGGGDLECAYYSAWPGGDLHERI